MRRRIGYSWSLFALAALAVPIDAAPGQTIELEVAPVVPGPPLPAMLAAGLALGLARGGGSGSVRRPVRRRPG